MNVATGVRAVARNARGAVPGASGGPRPGSARESLLEPECPLSWSAKMNNNPFRYFKTAPEAIRLAVMMCVRDPLSLHQVEHILFERGNDLSHQAIRFRWNRFGPMFVR